MAAFALVVWVVAVPQLHGHPPGAPAHDHGSAASVPDTGPSAAVDLPTDPTGDDVPLPLAIGITLLALVTAPAATGTSRARSARDRLPPRRSAGRPPPTPVARREVLVV
jgi:hypothetical protein